jgi:hypothetical protein
VFYRLFAIMIREYSVNVTYQTLKESIRSVFLFERTGLFSLMGAVYSKSKEWLRVPDNLDARAQLPDLDRVLVIFIETTCLYWRSRIQTETETKELLDLLHDISQRRANPYHEASAGSSLYWLHNLTPIASYQIKGMPSVQHLWNQNYGRRECDFDGRN